MKRNLFILILTLQSTWVLYTVAVQELALRREEGGPDRGAGLHLGHVIGDQALQEGIAVVAPDEALPI